MCKLYWIDVLRPKLRKGKNGREARVQGKLGHACVVLTVGLKAEVADPMQDIRSFFGGKGEPDNVLLAFPAKLSAEDLAAAGGAAAAPKRPAPAKAYFVYIWPLSLRRMEIVEPAATCRLTLERSRRPSAARW